MMRAAATSRRNSASSLDPGCVGYRRPRLAPPKRHVTPLDRSPMAALRWREAERGLSDRSHRWDNGCPPQLAASMFRSLVALFALALCPLAGAQVSPLCRRQGGERRSTPRARAAQAHAGRQGRQPHPGRQHTPLAEQSRRAAAMSGNQAGWAIALLWVLGVAAASAQTPPTASRGELLYSTHCGGCHSQEVHWRDRKIARDWTSLRAQVRRWQANAGLGWSEQEIVDVTRYLNGQYYHFAPPHRQAAAEHRTSAIASASR